MNKSNPECEVNCNELSLKPMKCELGFLSQADGSAILSQGETVALISVNGPLDIKMSSANIEKSIFELLFVTKSGKPSVADRFRENIIRQTCELALITSLHPRTAVSICVQEMEDFGGLMACSLNAVCLALINSGLAMNYLFAAVSSAVDKTGNIVIDPSQEVLNESSATMTFVFDSVDKKLLTCFTDGKFNIDMYKEALEKCKAASQTIFEFYREVVTKFSAII